MGTCLLQDEKSVYFASNRSAEGLCGNRDWVISSCMGHGEVSPLLVCKPLYIWNRPETIRSYSIQKPQSSNPRLQRILIRTFPYHFTLCYIPGITNQLANCLSRLGGQKDTIKLTKLYLYQITNQLCARSDSLNKMSVHTSRWWTCLVKTHYNARLTKLNQTSASGVTTILDFQRGTYCWRGFNLERYQNCHSSKETWSHTKGDT